MTTGQRVDGSSQWRRRLVSCQEFGLSRERAQRQPRARVSMRLRSSPVLRDSKPWSLGHLHNLAPYLYAPQPHTDPRCKRSANYRPKSVWPAGPFGVNDGYPLRAASWRAVGGLRASIQGAKVDATQQISDTQLDELEYAQCTVHLVTIAS